MTVWKRDEKKEFQSYLQSKGIEPLGINIRLHTLIAMVTQEDLNRIIETREPRGLFFCMDEFKCTAVDNSEGTAWTEEFYVRIIAEKWLEGAYDSYEDALMADYHSYIRIHRRNPYHMDLDEMHHFAPILSKVRSGPTDLCIRETIKDMEKEAGL